MKKVASYILFLALAAILLYFSFKGVKWRDFQEGLHTANYYWILLSMAFGVLAFWMRGMRWRGLIRGAGYQVSKGAAFDAVTMAYLTNFALPRAGELARCGVLTKTSGVPFDTLFGTVVLERSFDMLCLLMIAGSVIGLRWDVFGSFIERELWAPFIHALEGNILIALFILFLIIMVSVFVVVCRKSLLKFAAFKKMTHIMAGVCQGLKSGFGMENKLPFFTYTLIVWFCYWAMCQCTLFAFPAVSHLNWLDGAFLMVIGSFGWVVPVQGGMGAYHFIVSLALTSVYGIGQIQGLVFATISHESQAVTMILFGLFSLIRISKQPRLF